MLTDNKKKTKDLANQIVDKWVEYCNEAIMDKKHPPFNKVIEPFILALCESIRAEALKEVEGIIGEDELKLKAEDEWDSYENDKIAAKNQLRAEQRAVLAKLSKEEE